MKKSRHNNNNNNNYYYYLRLISPYYIVRVKQSSTVAVSLYFFISSNMAKKKHSKRNNNTTDKIQKRKPKKISTIIIMPEIPTTVIVNGIFPFLDRPTWNNFVLANREINKDAKAHPNLRPPWPMIGLPCRSYHHLLTRPAFSLNGEYIACGDAYGRIHLWSPTQGPVAIQQVHHVNTVAVTDYYSAVKEVRFSPANCNLLVSCTRDGLVRSWDLSNGRHVCLWTRHYQGGGTGGGSVSFSPNGECIAWGGGDRVRLLNASDGAIAREVTPVSTQRVVSVAFSPTGRMVAFGGSADHFTGPVELWNLDEPENTLIVLEGHTEEIRGLAFSPGDGAYLASASKCSLTIWNVVQGSRIRTLWRGPAATLYGVSSISFSPDGKYLASGCTNGVIGIWNVSNGECLRKKKLAGSGTAEFSPSGRMLLTSVEGKVRLRSMDDLEFLEMDCKKLMRLNVGQLHIALREEVIPFTTQMGKADLVDLLVTDLERSQIKQIFMRYRLGA
jgi:hypothetical protein